MIPINATETEALKVLLREGRNIELAVPANLEPSEIMKYIKVTASMFVKTEISGDKLKAVLGRLLVLAKATPETYIKAGYSTFEEFLTKEVKLKYRLSRATLFNSKKIAKAFPNLTIAQYGFGSNKLLVLAKFTTQAAPDFPKLLKAAEEHTYDDFIEFLERKGYISKEETTGAAFTVKGPVGKIKDLKRFLRRDDIKAAAESDDPLDIILAMSEEMESSWSELGAKLLEERGKSVAKTGD